jgi:hypothetical protein
LAAGSASDLDDGKFSWLKIDMRRYDLTDFERCVIEPLLPNKP